MSPPRPPDLLDRAWAAFVAAMDAPARAWSRADAFGLGFLALAGVALAAAPVLYIEDLPLDLFVQLDGAQRWMAGQRPHVDFYTPVGSFWYALLGIAGAWSGGDPLLVLRSGLLLLPFVTLGAWVATRDRLPDLPRVSLAAFLAVLAVSPRTLDSWLISGVATYNRYGWAFAGLVMAAVLLAPERPAKRWPEALVVALSMVALFHLKVTYLALVGGVLAVALVAVPETRWITVVGGGLGGLGVGASLAAPSTRAYLADLGRAAEAAGGDGLLRMSRLVPELRANQLTLMLLLALGFVLARTSRGPDEERAASRAVLGAVAVAVGLVGVTIQSHDKWIPLLVLPLAMLFAAFRRRSITRGERGALPTALAGVALCGTLLGDLGVDAQALARVPLPHASVPLVDRDGPGRRIRIPAGAKPDGRLEMVIRGEITGFAYDNLQVTDWRLDNGRILEDAIDLLARNGLSDARIASLTFSATFPVLLGSPPPRHLPSWWDWKRTVGPADAPRMASMLSDSDVVLVPVVWNITGIADLGRPVLQSEFEVRDRTPLWTLWVRKG